jgi:hypothetical protein
VSGAPVPAEDRCLIGRVDVAAIEVVVDDGVANAERHLVGDERLVPFQVGGGHLLDEVLRDAKVPADVTDPALWEAEQRREVGGAVAVLGEEADDRAL